MLHITPEMRTPLYTGHFTKVSTIDSAVYILNHPHTRHLCTPHPHTIPLTLARAPRREEKPFDDDDEVGSISDAGSLDTIDSDHEMGPEVEHPMSRMATAAMEDMARGQKMSMHETMSQLRDEYGVPTEPEIPMDPGEVVCERISE